MKALISGGSGLIGSALIARLHERGDEVVQLVRREADTDAKTREIEWNPEDPNSVDAAEMGPVDVVFNFSGVPVAKRWNKRYQQQIMDTRVETTRNLVEIISQLDIPPKTFITAGGMAIYGDRGDEQLTENSEYGEGFLASVAVPWEEATAEASDIGARTMTARFGAVMTAEGGALTTLVRPFRIGLGGRLGNGRQWTPWIHMDDAIRALIFMTEHETLNGAVNVVSPGVVRNSAFSRMIGETVGRPAFGWMPAIIARAVFGQYIQELGIASALAIPEKLLKSGFEFKYPELRQCLEAELMLSNK